MLTLAITGQEINDLGPTCKYQNSQNSSNYIIHYTPFIIHQFKINAEKQDIDQRQSFLSATLEYSRTSAAPVCNCKNGMTGARNVSCSETNRSAKRSSSASATHQVFYLKTHKTGSTTMFSILAEYCRSRELFPLLPRENHMINVYTIEFH